MENRRSTNGMATAAATDNGDYDFDDILDVSGPPSDVIYAFGRDRRGSVLVDNRESFDKEYGSPVCHCCQNNK